MSLRTWLADRLRRRPAASATAPAGRPTFSVIAADARTTGVRAGPSVELVPTLAQARGAFAVWLAPGDRPTPDAFAAMAAAIAHRPDSDWVFSDDAGPDGAPFHKPGWSPALLLAQPYALRLAAVRRELLERVGPPRPEYGEAALYEFALRATAAARCVTHVPQVLCRTAGTPAPGDQHRRAAAEAAATMGLTAAVERCPHAPVLTISVRPRRPEPITVIVPTRDRLDLLRTCVDSVLAATDHPDLRLLIVDNGSVEPATLAQLALWQQDPRVCVLRDDAPFDYAALMNRAVAAAATPQVLLLNNDTKAIDARWLSELAGWLDLPDVGAVGGKLRYADDTIQHAGVVLGIGGVASHSHKGFPSTHPGYHGLLHCVRDVSAVTGACLLTRRDLYLELGGLEPRLRVAYNDVDYCLRVRARGKRVIWTPCAELYHFEGRSRGDDQRGAARFDREIAFMQSRWGGLLAADPFYNPNLSLSATDWRRR